MPENTLEHLGQCMRDARRICKLTQQELADQTGVGLRHIQDIEHARTNPSYEVLLLLVRRLGISGDMLFYPDTEEENLEVERFLGKYRACTEGEREVILRTVECMADQFLRRRNFQETRRSSERKERTKK